ncbi:MAG: leucyl aminopeptidase family protein [Actinomycetota bacterium]|nr:leucyl aminopeptidase family protein [Actinomycetota bacterium]
MAAVDSTASTDTPLATDADTIAVGVFEDEGLASAPLDDGLQAMLDRGEAVGSLGRVAVAHHDRRRLLLVGLGPRSEFAPEQARIAAAHVHTRGRQMAARVLCWALPDRVGPEIVEGLVSGTLLAAYRFTRYKPAPRGETALERLIVSAEPDVSAPVQRARLLAEAQNRARDLANTAPNDLTPAALADYARELGGRHAQFDVSILDEAQIRDRGMGAFAAVAQGTPEDARLIELRYEPDTVAPDGARLGLIGKAVTFDSGGLALKPAARMMEMKFDMCGGAAVLEAIAALAELEAPVRVLGVVGAVENLPGPHAVRPGDVVTALDGTTIEIDNPDAEGRLVLADCITHARREGCAAIIDVATLTGAVEAALGSVYAGLMSNDDALAARAVECGERSGEPVWRLPLHPRYAEMTKGRFAVLTNRPEPRVGLASSAAEFLHHFAGPVPWAHLDMYAVAFRGRAPYLDKGGTGWGVRLLCELALGFGS